MTQGLLKKLALAAPLVVCLPLGALAADGSAAEPDSAPKVFEEFSLTSATTEAPGPMPCAPAPVAAPAPAPVQAPCVSAPAPTFMSAVCGDNCCPQFFSSVEATMFQATTRGMHADASVENLRDTSVVGLSNGDVFDRFTFSPRITAGVQEGCWGVLGRFWYMSDSTETLNPFNPLGSGVGTYKDERLKAYTADLEVTRSMCVGISKANFYLGARYASFEAGQGLDVSRLTSVTEIAYANSFTDFSFNGIGITTGVFGRTPIGCDTCISLVWGLRGSVLWGYSNRDVQTSDSVIDTGTAGSAINSASSTDPDTAFIIEGQVGAQWDHELRCLPMSSFLRLGFECQYWNLGSRGGASSTSFVTDAPGFATSSGSVGRVEMDLVGLNVGAGFNW